MLYIDLFHTDTYPNNDIFPNFTDGSFEAIINLCLEYCDNFSFTYDNIYKTFEEAHAVFKPFVIGETSTINWFSYRVTEKNPLSILLFPVNPETKKLLQYYCRDLAIKRQNIEDICFFKQGELIFGSVYHEYIYNVYPPDENFTKRLMQINNHWKTSDDERCKIRLSDYNFSMKTPDKQS